MNTSQENNRLCLVRKGVPSSFIDGRESTRCSSHYLGESARRSPPISFLHGFCEYTPVSMYVCVYVYPYLVQLSLFTHRAVAGTTDKRTDGQAIPLK